MSGFGATEAIAFLDEAARYFENRPTGGEDGAHWSNVYNAEGCRKIAALIRGGRTGTHSRDCPVHVGKKCCCTGGGC